MVGEAKSDARLYISGSAADVVASFQAGGNSKLVLQQLFFYMAANNLTCGFVTSSVRTYLVRLVGGTADCSAQLQVSDPLFVGTPGYMHVMAWFVSCYAKTCAHPDWSQLNWPDGMVWTAVQAVRNHRGGGRGRDGGGGSSGRGGGSRDDVDGEGDANFNGAGALAGAAALPSSRTKRSRPAPGDPSEALSLTVLPQSVWLRSAFLGHGRHGDVFAIPWPLSAVGPKPTCSVAVKAFESSAGLRAFRHEVSIYKALQALQGKHVPRLLFVGVRSILGPQQPERLLGLQLGRPLPDDFAHWSTTQLRQRDEALEALRAAGFEQSDTEPRNFVLLRGDDGTERVAVVDLETVTLLPYSPMCSCSC